MSELANRIEKIVQEYYGELWASGIWNGMEYAIEHYAPLVERIIAVCYDMDYKHPDCDAKTRQLKEVIRRVRWAFDTNYAAVLSSAKKAHYPDLDQHGREAIFEGLDLRFRMKLDMAIKELCNCFVLLTGRCPSLDSGREFVNVAEGIEY